MGVLSFSCHQAGMYQNQTSTASHRVQILQNHAGKGKAVTEPKLFEFYQALSRGVASHQTLGGLEVKKS